jgi:RNA polymerase sigma factor (sigma-70 family)
MIMRPYPSCILFSPVLCPLCPRHIFVQEGGSNESSSILDAGNTSTQSNKHLYDRSQSTLKRIFLPRHPSGEGRLSTFQQHFDSCTLISMPELRGVVVLVFLTTISALPQVVLAIFLWEQVWNWILAFQKRGLPMKNESCFLPPPTSNEVEKTLMEYDQHIKRTVRQYARRGRGGNLYESEVDDLIQDCRIRIWNTLKNPPSTIVNFKAYVTTIVKHTCYDYLHQVHLFPTLLSSEEGSVPWEIVDQNADPEQLMVTGEKLMYLLKALGTLPAPSQAIFFLCFFQDRSIHEVSERLGIKASTIRGDICRMRKRLRHLMQTKKKEARTTDFPTQLEHTRLNESVDTIAGQWLLERHGFSKEEVT